MPDDILYVCRNKNLIKKYATKKYFKYWWLHLQRAMLVIVSRIFYYDFNHFQQHYEGWQQNAYF